MSSPSDPTAAEDAAVSAGTPQAPGSAPPRRRTRRIVVGAAVVALLGLAGAGALADRGSHPPNVPLPLRTVAQMTLPAPSTRFDYADLDPAAHRLFLAQLGASRLLEIDTASRRVVRITAGLASVHGVIVVPSLHWVFATATGTNQLVALDETSGAVLYRAATGDYPDGLTYVASTGQLWISNESGGTETVLDAATGHTAGTVELGGEAGNVRYDPVHDRVLADVQTRNQIAVIDPHTRTILTRAAVPGCDHDHGLILDPPAPARSSPATATPSSSCSPCPTCAPPAGSRLAAIPTCSPSTRSTTSSTSPPSPVCSPPWISTPRRAGSPDARAWARTPTWLRSTRPAARRSSRC